MAIGAEVGAAGGIMSHPHLGNVPEFHDWDTVSEVDSVWIGFMDIVPVIGTVKEAVELVLALYEGDETVIREKAKAVENFVEESLKQPVKKSVPGKPAAATTDASDFSGLRNVREVRRELIIEYMAKGSKRGPKLTPVQKEQRKESVQDIKSSVLKKIQNIDPNFNQELQDELKRSKRGEHVFNNGILRFHSNVLDAFVAKQNIHNLQEYNQGTIAELGKHTLPQNTEDDIRYIMVVRFDVDEFYVNANARTYGDYCRVLLDALLAVLRHIKQGEETPRERRRVNRIIDDMNNRQIYVDQLAKEKWIDDSRNRRDRQDRQARFDAVRGQVATMYKTDRGLEWCSDVLSKVAPWFGTRH